MLKKSKEKFKSGLLLSSEEFKKTVSILLDEFRNKGPFNSDIPTEKVSECLALPECQLITWSNDFSTVSEMLKKYNLCNHVEFYVAYVSQRKSTS